jgi:tRNA splicing ligase
MENTQTENMLLSSLLGEVIRVHLCLEKYFFFKLRYDETTFKHSLQWVFICVCTWVANAYIKAEHISNTLESFPELLLNWQLPK